MKKIALIAVVACFGLFAVSCNNQPKEAPVEEAPAVEEVVENAEEAVEEAVEEVADAVEEAADAVEEAVTE